ncbi:uncharacterized protein DS421_19g657460 [Arachis hypogaea]|uniref:Uncharacterized protein n=1 Tax=Arachis hypogaea TaxID=3818 RepID=A0A6B9V932_ARAHY|nr:uncharacterized protein DS421_19g657460 [Arachis hypogaea]
MFLPTSSVFVYDWSVFSAPKVTDSADSRTVMAILGPVEAVDDVTGGLKSCSFLSNQDD